MTQPFVHLRAHSEYALVDGTVRIKALVQATQSAGMPAVAISDLNNLFGLVKFFKQAVSAGVKPIVACDVWVEDQDPSAEPSMLVLIALRQSGYKALSRVLSKGYTENYHQGRMVLRREWLKEDGEGLLALSAAADGDVGKAILAGQSDEAEARARYWQSMFPEGYYLELQRLGRSFDELHIEGALALSERLQIPVVATNDVRFMAADEFEAHEVRVCIHQSRTLDDPRREKKYSEEQYFKTAAEMTALFQDIPEAIENTVAIAQRCSVELVLGQSFLPEYPVPEGQTMAGFLEQTALEGLQERFDLFPIEKKPASEDWQQHYFDRLAFELNVINNMGFPGYFLIVMEFIQWAKAEDIPVGPGRGSGAGSLVAYALKITDVDPLEYDLLFERFLNPERVSLPDFDIDFCMDGRDRVIQHVTERYGAEAVSQIITFGTMAAKAVVRDVARVQGKSYGLADKLSKLIPFEPGMTLAKAMEEEPLLVEFVRGNDEAEEIMEMAFKLEGLARNVGRHAGGVVIAPTRLTDFSPTYTDDSGGGLMTQFDMNDVEQAGLVKFDFLGLRTLTIIDNAVKSINARMGLDGEPLVDIDRLDLEDAAIYADLQAAKTTAVFQLESRGMKDLMKRVKPNRFADIVALVALFRPGPLQLADDFIRRKHGLDEVDYLHPSLQEVLKDTYGVMLYQEQVMQIAQILAGYSLADADLLRRAMGKKKPEEMAKQRETFVQGAVNNSVAEAQAGNIFDLMEKFAGYGFNKPHSVCYALVAYQTAWLKHYYPADFMAAVMSADMQNTDKIVINVDECREMGLTLDPPNVNFGDYRFVAQSKTRLVYGLGAIKGLGEGPIEALVNARQSAPFKDLYDFCQRVDPKRLNRRALEALISAGALDTIGGDADGGLVELDQRRGWLLARQEEALRIAEQSARDQEAGLTDLFGELEPVNQPEERLGGKMTEQALTMANRLAREKEALGLYLTGHPIDVYRSELKHFANTRIADLRASQNDQVFAGWVVGLRSMKTQRGAVVFVTLDDRSARIEVGVFSDLLDLVRDKMSKDSLIVIRGTVSQDDFSGGLRVRASEVQSLVEARQRTLRGLSLKVTSEGLDERFSKALAGLLQEHQEPKRNGCPVIIEYQSPGACAELQLGDQWRVKPSDELLECLRSKFGSEQVGLQYHPLTGG